MISQVETWRVSTIEGVFETDLNTLKQWILEGCVLPGDKVSKGNLNWIEAGRAPMLRSAFAGEVQSDGPATTSVAGPSSSLSTDLSFDEEFVQPAVKIPDAVTLAPSAHVCLNHPQTASKYVCRECGSAFCSECPRFHGTSKIPLCPLCGDLCTLVEKLQAKAAHRELQSSGFGFTDFGQALGYPLQHKAALFFGAGLYGLLLLAGLRGRVFASVIMFGCISHVISQVAWGRLDRSFLPDFTEFSLWDDLAVPIGLGVGITIVTWGPLIVLFIALLFGVMNGAGTDTSRAIPNQDEQHQQEDLEMLSTLTDPDADPVKLEAANRRARQMQTGAQISQQAEASRKQLSDPAGNLRFLASYFKVGALIVVPMLFALAWGIFYYPMALAVAGYTQSFPSVINPMVGLDTIRRMGATYFKAFGMVLVIQVVAFILTVIVAVITSPFALPFVGNLPGTLIDGSVTFYFNLVIAAVLGLSLFKCADRLGIAID